MLVGSSDSNRVMCVEILDVLYCEQLVLLQRVFSHAHG